MEDDKKKKETVEPEFKDYVALVIALFQTTMLPFLIVIVLLFGLAFLLLFLSHSI